MAWQSVARATLANMSTVHKDPKKKLPVTLLPNMGEILVERSLNPEINFAVLFSMDTISVYIWAHRYRNAGNSCR